MTAASLLALGAATCGGGCAGGGVGATAPAAYKAANAARLDAVAPWLAQYAAEHPDRGQRVEDVVAGWRIEVEAQRGAAPSATAPGARPWP